MAHTVEQIQKSQKTIWIVGAWLGVFTIITVLMSHVELKHHSWNIALGMFIATIKSLLVALIFMHLKDEKKIIYKILLFTLIFVVGLFVLFILGYYHRLNHGT